MAKVLVLIRYTAFAAAMVLLLQPHIATADPEDDHDYRQRPPFILGACNGAVCGRGTCVGSTDTTLGYECECEEGWMQARPMEANFLKFLPCVIPNCTINYTCAEIGPPREYPNNPNIPNYPNYPYNPNNPRIPNYPNYPYNPNNPQIPSYPNYPYNPNNPYNRNSPSNRNGPYNLSFYNPCSFNDCGGGLCNITSPVTHNCICREGFYNLFNASIFPCYRECAFGAGCSSLGINTTTSILDPNPLLLYNGASLIGGAVVGCLIAALTTLAEIVWKFI